MSRAKGIAGLAVLVLGVSWLSVLTLKKRGPQRPGRLVVSYVVREIDVKKLSLFALLAMTATAEGQVGVFAHLTWQDKSNNEEGFRVYSKAEGDPSFTTMATLPADATSFDSILPLSPGVTYCWAVGAFNAAGENLSQEKCEKTPPLPGPTVPTAPDGLAVTYTLESPPPSP